VLTRGCRTTPERQALVYKICQLYPQVDIVEDKETTHAQVFVEGASLLERHNAGKSILAFGEHHSAVQFSREKSNCCPNYSPYGFFPYHCHYCYLAKITGIKFFPPAIIFFKLPEMLERINRIDNEIGEQTAFYLGKLQDPLALDPLTGYTHNDSLFRGTHLCATYAAEKVGGRGQLV
jgi:hypothetical protein